MKNKWKPSSINWQLKLLRLFCKSEYLEEIEGDLLERFERNPSKIFLFIEVLKLIRPILLRNFEGTYRVNYYGMIKNQLKTSIRFLKREKGFTLMNITGLSVGMACCLFIFLWLSDELKYNRHLTSVDPVYSMLNAETHLDGTINTYRHSPFPLKAILDENYPMVTSSSVLSNGNWMAFQVGEDLIEWAGVDASPEVFEMFEVDFLQGGYEKFVDNPNVLVISQTVAEIYFGETWEEESVVGAYMESDEGETFELIGVYKDLPLRSTMAFDFVVPFANRLKKRPHIKRWKNSSSQLYVQLKKDISITKANHALKEAINDHRVGEFQHSRTIFLQPFEAMYLYNRYENGSISGGRIDYVRLLAITAFLVLILATINFMNLTTARASKRAKETGIRKVLGASKQSIGLQFQIESTLLTFISAVVALAIVGLLLPQFETLTNKDFDLTQFSWRAPFLIFLFVLFQGFFTGLYPSFFLSSLRSITLLKSGITLPKRQGGFRKGLVVFQFSITLLMIIGSATVYQQVSYIQNKNIGLDRSNLIRTFSYDMDPVQEYQTYKDELLKRPGIESVTMVNQLLIDVRNSTSGVSWEGMQSTDEEEFYHMDANPDFLPTMKIALKEGRNFDWHIQSDTSHFIINEAAVDLMGLIDPIGKRLSFWGQKGRIIGVVKDFHNASLHSTIKPLIIRNQMRHSWMTLVRSKPGMNKEASSSLEEVFLKFNPNRTFWYRFVDDMYNAKYKSEMLIKKLSLYFTIVSMAISLLGLISLVTYSTELRVKEIGVRKILGASVADILKLLSMDYLRLLIVGIIMAFPISYIIMSDWLDRYAYRITLDWQLFAFSGACILTLAMLIIGLQTQKVATSNPIESLRDE